MPHSQVYSHPAMLDHDPAKDIAGFISPEVPERLTRVLEAASSHTLHIIDDDTAATSIQLARLHTNAYVQYLLGCNDQSVMLDTDTAISKGSIRAAQLAAGTSIAAVTAACQPQAEATFAAVRPPGHHAEVARAMGFCLFNNIAVAAQHALDELGMTRICIIDWDVHHGNGTQNLFYDRDDVLFMSIHQSPLYPGTGHFREIGIDAGEGFTINMPLPAGQGDADYLALFKQLIEPAIDRFCPELILISAGFDAHTDDPLGSMNVTTAGFAAMTELAHTLAERHCNGRMSLILEGGYDLSALNQSVKACLDVFTGTPSNVALDTPNSSTVDLIANVRHAHPQWFS